MTSIKDVPIKNVFEFDNRFIRELPGDPETRNSRRQVTGACYSRVAPVQVSSPRLIIHSPESAALLNFSKGFCESAEFVQIFSGNARMRGMDPYAMCYGGHQFGSWAGQLGDGRAINLGELINQNADRWVLQLKGAGPTPYSRTADGLAVLRSSIREFLCSEAMFHLGVPTTRALSLILTGEMVERDMFYDGHPELEPGAIVCRIAPSFTRFGNFEILSAREETAVLKQLVDYTIQTDFPELGKPSSKTYIQWFEKICQTTTQMIVHWMRVGFVHGVMNTDNMSILGLTIDYGPYGWLEDYDPLWTPNTTDARTRRYCFGNQPMIAHWNLVKLANALYPLIGSAEPLQAAVNRLESDYQTDWQIMMANKLGFIRFEPKTDMLLVKELFDILTRAETDYTIFFRNLALLDINCSQPILAQDIKSLATPLLDAYYRPEQMTNAYWDRFIPWMVQYVQRIQSDNLTAHERQTRMNRTNPKYVFRNYLAQQAIDKAMTNDFSMIRELLELLRHPYDDQPGKEKFAEKRPDWARSRPGCSMLSCSS